jgi:hypothetical protein
MMTYHLIVFNSFLLFSIAWVVVESSWYRKDTRQAEIACAVVYNLRSVSYFLLFCFVAYLMIRFSKPSPKVLPRMVAIRKWYDSD